MRQFSTLRSLTYCHPLHLPIHFHYNNWQNTTTGFFELCADLLIRERRQLSTCLPPNMIVSCLSVSRLIVPSVQEDSRHGLALLRAVCKTDFLIFFCPAPPWLPLPHLSFRDTFLPLHWTKKNQGNSEMYSNLLKIPSCR